MKIFRAVTYRNLRRKVYQALLAQPVEHQTFNLGVAGSSPAQGFLFFFNLHPHLSYPIHHRPTERVTFGEYGLPYFHCYKQNNNTLDH